MFVGAGEGTRTPTTAMVSRFSYHYSFHYQIICLWSGLYLHHSFRLRCPPSSLYTFKIISYQASLGITISQASPNLTGSTPIVSERALNFCD